MIKLLIFLHDLTIYRLEPWDGKNLGFTHPLFFSCKRARVCREKTCRTGLSLSCVNQGKTLFCWLMTRPVEKSTSEIIQLMNECWWFWGLETNCMSSWAWRNSISAFSSPRVLLWLTSVRICDGFTMSTKCLSLLPLNVGASCPSSCVCVGLTDSLWTHRIWPKWWHLCRRSLKALELPPWSFFVLWTIHCAGRQWPYGEAPSAALWRGPHVQEPRTSPPSPHSLLPLLPAWDCGFQPTAMWGSHWGNGYSGPSQVFLWLQPQPISCTQPYEKLWIRTT